MGYTDKKEFCDERAKIELNPVTFHILISIGLYLRPIQAPQQIYLQINNCQSLA